MSFVKVYLVLSVSFGFEGVMWNLIVLIPDHCLSVYFARLGLVRTVTKRCLEHVGCSFGLFSLV